MTKSKDKIKSQIFGTGYGDSHVWMRGHTNKYLLRQVLPYRDKCIHYKCRNCGVTFSYYYNVEPNISQAIKNSGIPDKCEKTKTNIEIQFWACRKCKKRLEIIPKGFAVEDIFSSPPSLMYCKNKKCKLFGFVVVAGIEK